MRVMTDGEAWGLRVYFGTLTFVFVWSALALWDRWRASRMIRQGGSAQ